MTTVCVFAKVSQTSSNVKRSRGECVAKALDLTVVDDLCDRTVTLSFVSGSQQLRTAGTGTCGGHECPPAVSAAERSSPDSERRRGTLCGHHR